MSGAAAPTQNPRMRMPEWPEAVAEAVVVVLAVGFAFGAGVVGYVIGHSVAKSSTSTTSAAPAAPVDPHVAAGAHIFTQFACVQCHGLQGRGGVSPDVPALTNVAKELSPQQLRGIIDHGLGESANPTKPYMPVWGEVISQTQVGDLIAYLRAGLPKVPTAEPVAIPQGQG